MTNPEQFELAGPITRIETIAVGARIRVLNMLQRLHGGKRWRKVKGIARVKMDDGSFKIAELHWYESHGVGRVSMKIKRYVSEI